MEKVIELKDVNSLKDLGEQYNSPDFLKELGDINPVEITLIIKNYPDSFEEELKDLTARQILSSALLSGEDWREMGDVKVSKFLVPEYGYISLLEKIEITEINEVVEILNDEIYENQGETNHCFIFEGNGSDTVVRFGDIVLWRKKCDERELTVSGLEPLGAFLKNRLSKYGDFIKEVVTN